ncbi:hypothetical protein [Rhizobium grahamii]|nr:hypothetical protein [Rhizobium grahamii]
MRKIVMAGVLVLSSCAAVTSRDQPIPYTLSEGETTAVQDGTRKFLKDPTTATFANITATQTQPGVVSVCGVVNSKNKAGAFTGGEPFAGVLRNTNPAGRAGFSFTLTAQGNATTNFNDLCRQNGVII